MNEAATHAFELRIRADHPALAGHFPGRPIVPGVVLLDHVIAGAERWLARPLRVQSLQHTKFIQPLAPEQSASVSLTMIGDELKFEIALDQARVAQGVFKLDARSVE